MKQSNNSPNATRYGSGGGLTVQQLKQMTALRMSQQGQGQRVVTPSPPPPPQRYEGHQYGQRGNYGYASGSSVGSDDRRMHRGTPPPKHRSPVPDKHRLPDGRLGKPADAPMPHGLTVQELKELTRIRLEREALERRGTGGSPACDARSETSSISETDSVSKSQGSARSSMYFSPAPPPARPFPMNGINNQQTMLHPNSRVFTPPQPHSGERRAIGKPPRGRPQNAISGVSDTSSTRSVSSSSTDEMSERTGPLRHSPLVRLSEPEPWELVPDEQLDSTAVDPRPSTMGSAIRQILTLDTSEQGLVPPPPQSPCGNPLSPRSLKNRPQMDVDCPEEIRRRSRSDSLVFEMAEAVLGTPPGSPVQPAINRKRMSGGCATALLLAGNNSLSPTSSYSLMEPSAPDESVLRRSDSGDSGVGNVGILGGLGSGIFRRGSGSSRRNSGSSENSSSTGSSMFSIFGSGAASSVESSFFPRRTGNTSTMMSFFQGVGSDLATTDGNSSPGKGNSATGKGAISDASFGWANKDLSKNKILD